MNTEWIQLTAEDGNTLAAYTVRPSGEPKAALVVVQEIFGVNAQIRKAAEEWAADGYRVVAPAMFDRFEKNVDLGYTEADFARGLALSKQFDPDMRSQVLDVKSAADWLRTQTDKPLGVLGFCFGGTMAWLASCRLEVDAAVGYYGGAIAKFANEEPQVPVLLHFGVDDANIPASARDTIQVAHPEVPIFLYEGAGHAFARSIDPNHYVAEAATLARKRSLLFFEQHLAF